MTGSAEKIYAQALFELGLENNDLDSVYSEVRELAGIFESNPELMKIYAAPTVTGEEKLKLNKELFGGRLSETVSNFLSVLTEKNRVTCIIRIAAELKERYYDYKGILEITAVTSVPMPEKLKEKLLMKLSGTTGKTVHLLEKVDPSILGGIILHYGNTQMDSSVKSRLDSLEAQVKSLIA